jgi:GxxExxY protein
LGPGLLENPYLHCLAFEVAELGVQSEMQVPLPLVYRAVKLDAGYRLDLWVDRKLIVEVKAVDVLHPVHSAQLITYLKLTGNRLGLLINFNEKFLKNGLRRIANGMPT